HLAMLTEGAVHHLIGRRRAGGDGRQQIDDELEVKRADVGGFGHRGADGEVAAGMRSYPADRRDAGRDAQPPIPNSRSISCCPIESQSSGTAISPGRNPSRRTTWPSGASSATTLTSGLPALAMMNASPRLA